MRVSSNLVNMLIPNGGFCCKWGRFTDDADGRAQLSSASAQARAQYAAQKAAEVNAPST